MAKIFIYLGIIILAIAAFFLGFKIYQQSQEKQAPQQNTQDVVKTSSSEATTSGSRSLQTPRLEVSSNILDITGCNPIPRQLDLKVGQEFQVKNKDNVPHTIIIDASHQFVIAATSTTTLSSSFGSSGVIGTIGYRCDDKSSENFAGTFHIAE